MPFFSLDLCKGIEWCQDVSDVSDISDVSDNPFDFTQHRASNDAKTFQTILLIPPNFDALSALRIVFSMRASNVMSVFSLDFTGKVYNVSNLIQLRITRMISDVSNTESRRSRDVWKFTKEGIALWTLINLFSNKWPQGNECHANCFKHT